MIFSCRQSGEFLRIGIARCDQGGDGDAPGFGQEIAVRAWHLADQVMCPQQQKLTRHRGGLAVAFGFRGGSFVEQQGSEIAVAEAVERELAAADRGEPCSVGRRMRIDCPGGMA